MDFVTLSAAWSFASAIGVALVGVALLAHGRPRAPGTVALGLFALVYGIQITLANAAALATDGALARRLHLLALAAILPLPYLALSYAAGQAKGPDRAIRLGRALAAAAAVGTVGLLALAPETIFRGVRVAGSALMPLWGPAYIPLVVAPFTLATAGALVLLALALRTAPTPRLARRAAILLLGLGLVVAFSSTNNFVFFLLVPWAGANGALLSGLFGLVAAASVAIALVLLADARAAAHPSTARPRRFAAVGLLVAAGAGAAEAVLASRFPGLHTIGLWRFLGVAVLAYGTARWGVLDLPERVHRAVRAAAGGAGAVATGVLAFAVARVALPGGSVPFAFAGLLGAAALIPGYRLTRRLVGLAGTRPPPPSGAAEQLDAQRIEAYRAAVEASLARGTLHEDEAFLARLRERFGIGPDGDRVVRHFARAAVLVPRSTDSLDVYDRLRLLAEGGAGRAWLARDRAHDRLVVLKQPIERWQREPATREMILREARLAARIRHPNVVRVLDVVLDKDIPVLVLEYVEGGTLSAALEARVRLPWPEALRIVAGVLEGLEATHAAGVIHRDVKPANVFLALDGTPKLGDFGISRAARGGATLLGPSPDARSGTLAYMAPEVVAGETAGDVLSDVYACGVLLHECLFGATPGAGPPPRVDPAVPPGILRALGSALSPDPAARPPGARAFREELLRGGIA